MPIDGRMYACTWDGSGGDVTGTIDFFELTPADDKPCQVHACIITQTTELGDAQEEQLRVEIQRGGTAMTTGSGGVAAAAGVSLSPSGAASGFTFEAGNTTLATFTAGVVLHREAFNVRTGWIYIPTPEMRPSVSQANGGLVVRLAAAPADAIRFQATLLVEEYG